MRIAVVMPVGPDEAELERCADTARSIAAWEPAVRWLVLVGESPASRDLAAQIDAGTINVVGLADPPGRRRAGVKDRVAAAVLTGLGGVARQTDADLVMKIDTDSLVIAPFADKLAAATADEAVGLVGSYDRTCNGDRRVFDPWVAPVKRAGRLVQPTRIAISPRARRVRQYVREGRAAGYEWGEHVLGCALAIPRRTLDAIERSGALDDPFAFAGTRIGDDPILALLVRRAGYRLAGDVEEGATFGVKWRGLPDTPERLLARGYSIIHSVKNDKRFSEDEIRHYFDLARNRIASSSGADAKPR